MPQLNLYDTGERCEPKLWQPDEDTVRLAMRDGELDDIGNVDFDDDEDRTICTVRVSRNVDATHTVHIIPFVGKDQLIVERHDEE